MQFGVHLPHIGRDATAANVARMARKSEDLGYESLWVSDHVALPQRIESAYPYAPDHELPVGRSMGWLDPIQTLTFAAACTEQVRLGVSVLVLAMRQPVWNAKQLITLDVLSQGRFILGVGVGWMKEEFDVLEMPWDHRGQRVDEQLEMFRTLFREQRPEHHGRFYDFEPIGFNPKPIRGRIPIWVGGHSAPAYRRAAVYGDDFHAVALHSSPAQVQQQWHAVQRDCEAVDRDPASITLSLRASLHYGQHGLDDGSLHGSDDQLVDTIAAWQGIGVSHIAMNIVVNGNVEQQLEDIEAFASNVRPQLR